VGIGWFRKDEAIYSVTVFTTVMMWILIAIRWVHLWASVVLASIFVFKIVILAPLFNGPSALPPLNSKPLLGLGDGLAWKIWLAETISNLFWLWAVSASMSGVDLLTALSPDVWSTVLFDTKFGHLWMVRLGIEMILGLSLWLFARGHFRTRYLEGLVAALAMALLVSIAWAGHAAAGVDSSGTLHLANDAVHLGVTAFWPGGLVPFAVVLFRMLHAQQSAPGRTIAQLTRRFSISSLIAVAFLSLTGLANSVFLVGSIPALLATLYGQMLLCKLILFLTMVGIGAWNLFGLRPKLEADDPAENLCSREAATHSLLRNIFLEIVLGATVILIVAALGITAPPTR
jgi:putative copper resistance protein D